MKPCGIITLTSDFGQQDGFVGAMRGRLLSLVPSAKIHDISHQIAPQNVYAAAWCLRRAISEWPKGSIHLAVVDPGVGSDREALIVCCGNSWLVGPDNGVLSLAAEEQDLQQIFAVDSKKGIGEKSASFDGLHLFVPIAARLLQGAKPTSMAREVEDYNRLQISRPSREKKCLIGEVLLADRFGNCMTNITQKDLPNFKNVENIQCSNGRYLRLCNHYSELLQPDAAGALFNSYGYLELAMFCQSIQQRWQLHPGAQIRIQLKPPSTS